MSPSAERPALEPPAGGPGCGAMVALFVGLLGVALAGLEWWTDRFAWPVDPAWYRLEEAGGTVRFGCQNFRPVEFPAVPARTRVVVLGGSVAFGYPDRPVGDAPLTATVHGVAGALQATLDAGWPARFEVVNLGVNGGTSEDTLRLARRALAWGPAALVLLDGNNEFMDVPATAAAALWRLALYRRIAVLQPRVDTAPGWVGAPAWGTPALREAVHARLRRNVAAVVDLAAEAGVAVVVSTQAANLTGFDPSWSTEGDAAALADLAARSDAEVEARWAAAPGSADLAWAVGQRRLEAGGDALPALRAAADLDAMPFRPTTSTNAALREAAGGAVVVDAEVALAPGGLPGADTFYDWVHPQPEAAGRLGAALARGLQAAGVVPAGEVGEGGAPAAPAAERASIAARVSASWLQWACVRAHDPGFRARRAGEWAERAARAEGGGTWPAALGAASRALADPGAGPPVVLSDPDAARLAGIHRCLAEKFAPRR